MSLDLNVELEAVEATEAVHRIYDSLTGLLEGLAAAKVLELRDVTVTTTFERGLVSDNAVLPNRFRYHLDATAAKR